MAISEAFQSSHTVTTSEWFLASDSGTKTDQLSDGVYQLFLELVNVAAGDIFQVKCYESISSGGTARVVWIDNVSGPLDSPNYVTPVADPHARLGVQRRQDHRV